jgi:hypothetical protein
MTCETRIMERRKSERGSKIRERDRHTFPDWKDVKKLIPWKWNRVLSEKLMYFSWVMREIWLFLTKCLSASGKTENDTPDVLLMSGFRFLPLFISCFVQQPPDAEMFSNLRGSIFYFDSLQWNDTFCHFCCFITDDRHKLRSKAHMLRQYTYMWMCVCVCVNSTECSCCGRRCRYIHMTFTFFQPLFHDVASHWVLLFWSHHLENLSQSAQASFFSFFPEERIMRIMHIIAFAFATFFLSAP